MVEIQRQSVVLKAQLPNGEYVDRWFLREMLLGVQSLMRLSLWAAPETHDGAISTANAFGEALWEGRKWDEELDSERIKGAWGLLAQGFRDGVKDEAVRSAARRFPLPVDFTAVLPKRSAPADAKQLEAPKREPPTPEQRALAQAKIRRIMRGTFGDGTSQERLHLDRVNGARKAQGKRPYATFKEMMSANPHLRGKIGP